MMRDDISLAPRLFAPVTVFDDNLESTQLLQSLAEYSDFLHSNISAFSIYEVYNWIPVA